MEKEKSGNRILRRTTKMPTAASASNTQDVTAASAASASSPADNCSIAVDSSSPSRPSSPTATMMTAASSTAPAAPSPVSAAYPKYHYTRDELLNLKNCPLSKLKPKFLTPVHELCDICVEFESTATTMTTTSAASRNATSFDEQTSLRPGTTSKRQLSLVEQRSSAGQLNNDCDADAHIVLVPQRSSFGTGCHVAPGRNVNSPEAKRERNRRDGHRIGSGRIQISSEKYVDREVLHDHRGSVPSDRERDRNDRWYDRCGNGSKVMKRDYDGRRSEAAYRDGRYMGDSTMRIGVEPEWFTEGPISQSDTIELHGFECLQKTKRSASKERMMASSSSAAAAAAAAAAGKDETKMQQRPNSLPKTTQLVATETAAVPRGRKGEEEASALSDEGDGRNGVRGVERGEREEELEEGQSSIVSMVTDPSNPLSMFVSGKDVSRQSSSVTTSLPPEPPPPPHPPPPPPPPHQTSELDFNAFFNADSIPGLNDLFSLEAGGEEQAVKGGSRFQQWFHFSSHGNSHCESRRSSLTDEFGYINDIIYGHNSPLHQMSPPPTGNPLPPPPPLPAATCGSSQLTFPAERYSDETQNLLEMLQRANAADGCVGGSSVPFNASRRDAASAAAAAENRMMNYCMPNEGDCDGRMVDRARDVEAGLKAILSGGSIFAANSSSPLLSMGFLSPSIVASLALAGPPPPPPLPPPFGAKVLLAEELEAAHLVAAGAAAVGSSGQGHHSTSSSSALRTMQQQQQDVYSTSSGGHSHCPPTSPWNNSGTLSFFSLPVLPVGTKVTLLSDLEAGLKGLSVVNGNHGGGGIIHAASQPLLGSGANDCHGNSSLPVGGGPPPPPPPRPASSSHGDDDAFVGGQLMSSSAGSVFSGRPPPPPSDLAAYKKLLGLIAEPHGTSSTTSSSHMAANNNNLPIVTSPTSVSMSNLEANQPNNSLANNQRDFIQRYLLQQQQLKMLHHQQPPPPPPPQPTEGPSFSLPQSGLPPHLMPHPSSSDPLPPHQSYLSPGIGLTDPTMSSGGRLLMMGSPQQQQQQPHSRTDFALSPGAELQHQHHHHHHQQQQQQQQGSSSCGYDSSRRTGGGGGLLGLSLNLASSDDLAALIPDEFSGCPYPTSHLQGSQAHMTAMTSRGHYPGAGAGGQQIQGGSLLPPHHHHQQQQQQQHHEMTTMTTTLPISQLSSSQSNHHHHHHHHLLLQESAKQAIIHQASLQQHHHHQQQHQQMARMTHHLTALHDPLFNCSTRMKPCHPPPPPLSPHPGLPPHLTLQPPPVSSHPSPVGLSMLGPPQSLLQQPPQSPRRAPSPIMFGNQPPMNLTAPLPVHLGPMTPILSPTLSPNTLQVAQTGSNLSSPVMRVPSPQELSGLAQSILQNALIKKQLEEQKERFIRRQQERNKSPKPQQAPSSVGVAMTTASSRVAAAAASSTVAPSMLSQSFLPTSVLRKMASTSRADERTRLTDSLSSSSCSGEKNVPLLKVVKPDEDSAAEDEDKENKGLMTNVVVFNNSSSSSRLEQETTTTTNNNNRLPFISDDHRLSSEMENVAASSSIISSHAVAGATAATATASKTVDALSSSIAKQLSQQQQLQSVHASTPSSSSLSSSAVCSSSTETAGLQSQAAATERLLGHGGLMNNASSSASATGVGQVPPPPSHPNPTPPGQVSPAALHPSSSSPAAAAAGAGGVSGRQIKGKKMPEHMSVAASTSKSRASEYHHQLQQQQQQQFFAAGGSSSCGNAMVSTSSSIGSRTAPTLNVHAMEMAKLVDQQRKQGLLSSSSPMPSPAPHAPPHAPHAPSIATQFVSAGPENGSYGVAPLQRMLVHPTPFGVNSPAAAAAAAASNALLLQRLAYPNLQRAGVAGLSSVNHLNLNQLALMQAVQLQAQQQQQQQQQQLWNRNAMRNLNNHRGGPYPSFASSSSLPPHPSAATTVVAAAASSSKQPGGGRVGGAGVGGMAGGGVGGVNGLKTTTSVGLSGNNNAMQQMMMTTDNGQFMSGTNLPQHLHDAANRSSGRSDQPAPAGTDAGGRREHERDEQEGAKGASSSSRRPDLATASSSTTSTMTSSMDVGNLAKWFGSDVFSHQLPPLVTSAGGQKVLTVDEIEGWQRAIGES